MDIDSILKGRPGIHEARVTCKQLTCFEERVSPLLEDEGTRKEAENYALYILGDNQVYFDWLCKDDEYKKVAANIQLAPQKQFTEASQPYVKDLFDINSALQYARDYCQNSANEVVYGLTGKFQALHERYIDFSNRVLKATDINYSDLKKALTKFFHMRKWSEFKVKFPSVLSLSKPFKTLLKKKN